MPLELSDLATLSRLLDKALELEPPRIEARCAGPGRQQRALVRLGLQGHRRFEHGAFEEELAVASDLDDF